MQYLVMSRAKSGQVIRRVVAAEAYRPDVMRVKPAFAFAAASAWRGGSALGSVSKHNLVRDGSGDGLASILVTRILAPLARVRMPRDIRAI